MEATCTPNIVSNADIKSIDLSNNDGLFRYDGKIYSLLGYINHLDARECHVNRPTDHDMPMWVYQYIMHGLGPLSPLYQKSWQEIAYMQLKSLKINIAECHLFFGGLNTIFVFSIHRKPLKLGVSTTSNETQALFDYVSSNKYIPHIISDYRLANKLSKTLVIHEEESLIYPDEITIKNLPNVLGRFKSNNTTVKNKQETELKREEIKSRRKNNEAPIVKKSDYDSFQKEHNIDLNALHQRIVSQANRSGGFVNFIYKNQTFKIPKLPLIAWASNYNKHANSFEYNDMTWRVYSPDELKCSDDGRIHSDWWIGAGIPVETYDLAGGGYSHQTFNHELTEFAFELVKKNTLENFTVLSGNNLTPYRGNVNIHPSSLDDVTEGDILILPNGGVDFDLYLKKACANGKGAVILEVGNRVSHLSIVANEMGYRVILLPNIEKLLTYSSEIEIDTHRRKITKF